MAIFAAGDSLTVQSTREAGRFLLLAGEPLNEPVSRHGPFVMNTHDELVAAVEDFHAGKMGVIQR